MHTFRLQYRQGERWYDLPPRPLYILKDTSLTVRAVPAAGRWNRTRLRWRGLERLTGRGTVRTAHFSQVARHRGDFQILTVQADEYKRRISVLVYDLEPTMIPDDIFPGRDMDAFGIGEKVWLSVKVTPFVPVTKLGGLEWGTDRFPGDATVIDTGTGDGRGVFNVGSGREEFTVRVKVLSGPSQGQTRGILMTAATPGGRITVGGDKRELYGDLERINATCRTMKLAHVERLAAAMEAKWRSRPGSDYLAVIAHVCNLLTTVDFGEERRFVLAQRYARLALPVAQKSAPGAQTPFVIHLLRDLEYDSGAVRGETWARLRCEKVTLWLDAIREVSQAIDWSFDLDDPKHMPFLNLVPPAESGLPAGVSPEAVTDPKARAAYEASLAENRRKARRLSEQRNLRDRLQELWSYGEDYIVRAYRKPPTDSGELWTLLQQYGVESKRAQRIIARAASRSVSLQQDKVSSTRR